MNKAEEYVAEYFGIKDRNMEKMLEDFAKMKCENFKQNLVNEIPDQKTASAQRAWLRIRKKILNMPYPND